MVIRGAGDAAGFDPGIDGPGKAFVFNQPNGLAGEIRHVLSLSGRLDPAVVHSENNSVPVYVNDLLLVDKSVKPQPKGLL
jgi:hypothetical protein